MCHTDVRPRQVCALAGLKVLGLNQNQLTSLPAELASITGLEQLSLKENSLSAVPPELGQFTVLQALDLSSNAIRSLPNEFCNLASLAVLALRDNQLVDLPAQFSQLTSLISIGLQQNSLAALPPQLWALTQLQALDVAENQITELPAAVGVLTNLHTFGCAKNRLTGQPLPPTIRRWGAKLENLMLEGNAIQALPREISDLKALKVCYAAEQPLGQEQQRRAPVRSCGTCLVGIAGGRETCSHPAYANTNTSADPSQRPGGRKVNDAPRNAGTAAVPEPAHAAPCRHRGAPPAGPA
jgi:hypothetical protein